MGFKDYWDEKRSGYERYLWAALFGVLREVGELAAKELADGLSEYLKESKTPDGWTKEEYLTYAIGRLRVIEEEEIGPGFIDNMLDAAIESLVKRLQGKLDGLEEEEPEPEPPPVKLEDPYWPTKYGPDDTIPYERLRTGDKVYKDGLERFVIPHLFSNYAAFVIAAQGATLIDVVGED